MQKQNKRAKCTGVKFLVCMHELGNKADSDSDSAEPIRAQELFAVVAPVKHCSLLLKGWNYTHLSASDFKFLSEEAFQISFSCFQVNVLQKKVQEKPRRFSEASCYPDLTQTGCGRTIPTIMDMSKNI
ncbi:hypothetical protein CHARACLAT_031036 [Characodon lateralis]|uniref:Uncharacterized protein n=1 Tax=Characodon lateralis TaxID=208331 RepID=A0ABU7EPC4_9TELE|nr:hypothetical protein [Characodon lateralis]